MAEVIASTLIEAVSQKLVYEAIKQVVRANGIHSELKKLERTLFRIQALLNDAWNKEITNEAVQAWLNELQHLAYDIDDILDDLATEAMHNELTDQSRASTNKIRKLIPACCAKFSLSTRLSHKLDNITNKLQELEKEKRISWFRGEEWRVRSDKDELIDKLIGYDPCKENFSVVPIVGMGGVGKTTLAKILYNDKQVNSHFELKAWVCVSDEWDSFQISKSIFQSVTGEDKKFENFNLLQEALVTKLREKQFLLVLDDVWTESYNDWETLVRPFSVCARGSKVIITTRKDQLLKELGCSQLKQLHCLSPDDDVSLFCQNALDANNFDLYPTLKAHGEDIVGKCKGLPLALIELGRLLRRKETNEVRWKEMVDSKIWSLKEGGGIIPALKLSYHELPASLKQLFAYCSLFPKDYLFDKDDLVLIWMADGFLHQLDPSKPTEERLGHDYFEELLSRSFFRHAPDDGSLFVMHDLMHDLATSIAGKFFFRLEKEMGKDVWKQALKKLRHMGERKVALPYYLPDKVLVDLLPELQFLRVLSLSGYEISEVPDSIAREANLSQKRLTEFEVEWSDGSRIAPMETVENAILDALKPYNDCLEKLGIVNYLGLEFPKWVVLNK
ncbi:NBS-LRR resistance-like protein [Tanacetum coccineum]